MVNVLLNKPTPDNSNHPVMEITENPIKSFVFFVSSCESNVQDFDDHYRFSVMVKHILNRWYSIILTPRH